MYHSKKERIRRLEVGQEIAASIFISVVTIISLIIFWFSLFEPPPLYYRNLPFRIINGSIHPGDSIAYKVYHCNEANSMTTYTITRYLQSLDGKNLSVILGSTDSILMSGCSKEISLDTVLPKEITPGRYRILGRAEVQGTVKKFYIDWYTEPFIVK